MFETAVEAGIKKANMSALNQFILGMLAGAFIAFGAQAANVVGSAVSNPLLAKFTAGLIFPTGLILVVCAGAELFTGNCLMSIAWLERKISSLQILRSWLVVYIGNFAGGALVAWLVSMSGQLSGPVAEYTVKVAVNKTSLTFLNAFVSGILCNWLVCLAVWVSFGAKDTTGKILAVYFPIWLFVASGFEHSVANMYYITAGIIEGAPVSFAAMLTKNLVPVTLGNIVGGAGCVGFIYWLVLRKKAGTRK